MVEETLLGEGHWQALLDSAGEGIWGVDLNGTCTFVNRAAQRSLGYSAEELVGRNMHAMVHHHYPDGSPYPAEECSVYNVFRRSSPFTNKLDHVIRKDGSLFYAEMSAQPIVQDGQVRGAVVTFRDVTMSRLADEALRRSEKLAAVGQLASSIAHEINNPLEAVTNLLYLVRTADSMDDVKTYAVLAETELARVVDITMQTLRFHRQQTMAAAVDLNDVIPAVLRLYTARFTARRVELAAEAAENAYADAARGRCAAGVEQPDSQCLRRDAAWWRALCAAARGAMHEDRAGWGAYLGGRYGHGISAEDAKDAFRAVPHLEGGDGDGAWALDFKGDHR